MDRDVVLKKFINEDNYEIAKKLAVNNSDRPLYAWYVEILNKSLKELTCFDLIRCIRQEIFVSQSVFEIIERMKENNTPFFAEIESVELMEKLSSVSEEELKKHKSTLEQIFENINENDLVNKSKIWLYDEEKSEYLERVDKIKRKIE